MTRSPVAGAPEDSAYELARLMRENDCGAIPIVEGRAPGRLVGVVTDRDLALHVVGEHRAPSQVRARELMSSDLVVCSPDDLLGAAAERMRARQVRRIFVVSGEGHLLGILAQADLARGADDAELSRTLRELSRPEHREPQHHRCSL